MEPVDHTSLKRFLATRGSWFLGQNTNRNAIAVQIWLGGFFAAAGVIFAATLIALGHWRILPTSLGLLIPGSVNLAVGLITRKKFGQQLQAPVPLSREARQLMARLKRKFGLTNQWDYSNEMWASGDLNAWMGKPSAGGGNLVVRGGSGQVWIARKHESQMDPSDEVLNALEGAAFQYNRVFGSLATNPGNGNSVEKILPRVSAAADEGMAEILHTAAMLSMFPEGGAAATARIGARTKDLKELADRVESLSSTEPSITERVGYRSTMDGVLEDLRLEQLARSELHASGDEAPRVNLSDR